MKSFSPNIDLISENIIYLHSLNSRLTTSELAKKLKVNRKIVENRTQKLYKKGFIKPLLIYNYSGLIKATILIKLSAFDEKIIDAIMQLKKLAKLKETLGKYDLSLLIITEEKKELDDIINKINGLFHNRILDMDVIMHDLEDTLGYKSFCHNLEFMTEYKLLDYDKKHIVSKDEKIVLDKLILKPDLSYKELIKLTGWNYQKIKNIIFTLKSKEIIRVSIDPDYKKLGLEFHNILLKINLAKKSLFENNITKHPQVHWIKKGFGRWDYILSVTARNISEFIDISREIRTQNKDIILDFSSLISKIHMMRQV